MFRMISNKATQYLDYAGSLFAIVGVLLMSVPSPWMVPVFMVASVCFGIVGYHKSLHGLLVLQIVSLIVQSYTLWKITQGVW